MGWHLSWLYTYIVHMNKFNLFKIQLNCCCSSLFSGFLLWYVIFFISGKYFCDYLTQISDWTPQHSSVVVSNQMLLIAHIGRVTNCIIGLYYYYCYLQRDNIFCSHVKYCKPGCASLFGPLHSPHLMSIMRHSSYINKV